MIQSQRKRIVRANISEKNYKLCACFSLQALYSQSTSSFAVATTLHGIKLSVNGRPAQSRKNMAT